MSSPLFSPRPLSRRTLFRGFAATSGAAAFASALAACGSSGSSSALAADATGSLKGATINAMVNQPHQTAFTEILAKNFKQEFGGTLKTTAIPYDQLGSKQILDVQGGSGDFDVFDYFYFELGSLVDANVLVDLTDWIGEQSDINTADFLPSIYDTYTLIDGKRYGLPFDGDTHVLFVNQAAYEKYKIELPKTWDDYDDATKKITTDSKGAVYGAVVEAQQVPMILGCTFINRLAGYGGSLVDADGKPTLTTDAAKSAAQGLVDINKYALPTPLQVGFDAANAAYLGGTGAAIDTWTDMALRAETPSVSKIVGKTAVLELPVGGSNTTPRAALDAGFGLGVSTGSKQQTVAAEFVKWATSQANNLALASTEGTGIDPARLSVLKADSYAKAVPVGVPEIRAGLLGDPLAWPKSKNAAKALQSLVDELALAIQGKQTSTAALENSQSLWEKDLP